MYEETKSPLRNKVSTLVTILVLFFSARNTVQGQEIVKITGKDGKKTYANTEETYQLVDNLNFSSQTAKIQTTTVDNQPSQKIDNLIDHISGQHGVDPELV